MRNPDGTMQANAHLKGMFLRLCKLLSMKVKPVLVFDGKMPALKRKTNEARRKGAKRSQGQVTKLAEQLLRNKIKAHALKQVLEQQQAQVQGRQPSGGGGSGSRTSFDFTNPNAAGRVSGAGVENSSGGAGAAGGGGGGAEDDGGGIAGGGTTVETNQQAGITEGGQEWEWVEESSSDDDEFSMIRGMGSKAGPKKRRIYKRLKTGDGKSSTAAGAAVPGAGAGAGAGSGSGATSQKSRVRPVSSSESGSDDEAEVNDMLGERVAVALPPGGEFCRLEIRRKRS